MQDVLKLLTSGTSRPVIKKKAALCLLRLIRKASPEAHVVTADMFGPILNGLLEERDVGVLLATMSLLLGIVSRTGPGDYRKIQSVTLSCMLPDMQVHASMLCMQVPACKCMQYAICAPHRRNPTPTNCPADPTLSTIVDAEPSIQSISCALSPAGGLETCVGRIIRILERLVGMREINADYTYYGIACPWLQCKALRALQYFPPPEVPNEQQTLHNILQTIIKSASGPPAIWIEVQSFSGLRMKLQCVSLPCGSNGTASTAFVHYIGCLTYLLVFLLFSWRLILQCLAAVRSSGAAHGLGKTSYVALTSGICGATATHASVRCCCAGSDPDAQASRMQQIPNKVNTSNAILFDAIALCLAHGSEILTSAVDLLAKFLSSRDSNTRCPL